MRGVRAYYILNTEALAGPTGALPNPDPLPLYSSGERACPSYAVLDERLSRAAGFALLSRDLALRWSFFLLVRWCPPLPGDSYRVTNRLQFMLVVPLRARRFCCSATPFDV
jgi:hypothetical protein